MKFYGRLAPGITTDLATPLELIMHLPRKASGIVVKLWEKATYTDIDGTVVTDDGGDDLLLELHGQIEPDPALRRRGRGKFVVASAILPPRDPKVRHATLKVTVEGDDTVYEAAVPSTDAELNGQNFEIAITIEHGGAQVFASEVPTFIRPRLAGPRVVGKRVLDYQPGTGKPPILDDEDEVMLAGFYATLGIADGDTDDGHLIVTGVAMIDESGRLQPCDAEGQPLPGELLVLHTHKDLFAHITPDMPKVAKTVGDRSISLRLCHPVEPDGTIELALPHTNHLFGFTASEALE